MRRMTVRPGSRSLVFVGVLLLGGASACGMARATLRRPEASPSPSADVPLPEGWTRQQFIDRFIQPCSNTPKGLLGNHWMGVKTLQNGPREFSLSGPKARRPLANEIDSEAPLEPGQDVTCRKSATPKLR